MKNKFNLLFRLRTFRYDNIPAMIVRNHGQPLVAIFIRIWIALGGRCTVKMVKIMKIILSHCSYIAKTQGLPGLVKRLKMITVLTQQSLCGHKDTISSPRISVTSSGIPRMFPPLMRRFLRIGSQIYIKFALTFCSLYRDIKIPGTLKINSITSPFTGKDNKIRLIIKFIPKFVSLFVKQHGGRQCLIGKFSYNPIGTSSPQAAGLMSTNPYTLIRSAKALTLEQIQDLKLLSELSIGNKLGHPFIKRVHQLINLARGIVDIKNLTKPVHNYTGKLGIKEEAAGKVRVFAMVDPWTQLVLAPLHKGLFNILKRHNNVDGTFNQLSPIERIWRLKGRFPNLPLYSMDLSSATDRLPISIQTPLIQAIFGLTLEEALAWERLLIKRPYMVPQSANTSVKEVIYAVGQPMGALSSWGMLAMTHHLIIQFAAFEVFPNTKGLFTQYAVLGDDVVICNHKVAKRYHTIMTEWLGVECNLSKSVISPKGIGLEFAKRTFIQGLDMSPAPLKEFSSALETISGFAQYCIKYRLSITQVARVAGFGWRVCSSMNRPWIKMNLKLRYILLMTNMVPGGIQYSFEIIGRHLNKYVYKHILLSFIFEFIRKTMITVIKQIYTCQNLLQGNPLLIWNPGKTVSHQRKLIFRVRATGKVLSDKVPLVESLKLLYSGKLKISEKLIKVPLQDTIDVSIIQEPFAVGQAVRVLKVLMTVNPMLEVIRIKLKEFEKSDSFDFTILWTEMMNIINLNAKSTSVSFESFFTKANLLGMERRIGAPKAFRMHQAFNALRVEGKSFVRNPPIQTTDGNEVRMSGFVPPIRLILAPMRKFLTRKLILRILFRRLIWTSSFLSLMSVISFMKGIPFVIANVLIIWTTIQTLLSFDTGQGSSSISFWSVLGNVILHSAELYIAATILLVVTHYSLYHTLWMINFEALTDGALSPLGLCLDFISFTNRLMLDVASGITTSVTDYVLNRRVSNVTFLGYCAYSILGYSLTYILYNFIRWFIGI